MSRILSILLAVVELLLAPLALFLAGFSVMMFDAPGSTENPALQSAFLAFWLMPVALLIGAGFAIAAAFRYSHTRIIIALAVPGLVFVWLAVALAMVG